jgi:hypothetical protein
MSALIEARRRAREAPPTPAQLAAIETQPTESEAERRARNRAANMGTAQPQTFGYDPRKGGGVFQIERLGIDSADFMFFGWNRDIKRNTLQHIEVRRGNNPDIRVAVVRKMISIIREYEPGDFQWESFKLGRWVTLSARASDNAGLEDFMMREFFDGTMAR